MACVKMEITTDVDADNIIHEDISNKLTSEEGDKKILRKEIELLTLHQLMHDEKSKKEAEAICNLNKKLSKEKHEEIFFDEKLENEIITGIVVNTENEIMTGIVVNRENECDKLNTMVTSDVNKIKNTINTNNYNVSADIQNITQLTSKENEISVHECCTAVGENIYNVKQEALQESLEIVESNNTNIVQNKYANKYVTNQDVEVNVHNNKIVVKNPSLQKQDNNGISSLNIIAEEYGDIDSDTEEIKTDTIENQHNMSQIPIHNLQQYRTVKEQLSCEEIDSEDDSNSSISSSSSSRSSSTGSSSSSSSDSSSDSEPDNNTNINNRKKESKATTSKKKKHIQNELDNLPPIEDLKINVPEVLCNPLGKIEKTVEQLVIVKPNPGEPTLNLDTVLFVNKGTKALGKIFDVFGSVNEPYYCVRFNNAKHIQDNDIKVGMQVYYCPNTEYTSLVFLHELTKIKACDAIGDDEPPAFSDDEEEQAYYENLKQKNNKDGSDGKNSQKRQRRMGSRNTEMSWQSNHPWNKNRNIQFQRYNQKKQQNWNSGSHLNNSIQNGGYSYNEFWQQYSYQNNWQQPVPQNIYPMLNRPYAEYRTSYTGSRLPQYGNPNNSDGTHQYFQEINYHPNVMYPSNVYTNMPSCSTWQPMLMTNTHLFPLVPPSSSNITDMKTADSNSSK